MTLKDIGTRACQGGLLAAKLGIAGLAGYGAHLLSIPLAWVLGPLVCAAIIAISGFDVGIPDTLRRTGQVIIGASIGLRVTAEVFEEFTGLLPILVGAAVFGVMVAACLSLFLAVFARTDNQTAFLAMLPGGLAEMGNVALEGGANAGQVVVAHSLRVATVVLIVPPLLILSGHPAPPSTPHAINLASAAAVLVAGALFAWLVRRIGLNNPWMLGTLIFSGTLSAMAVVSGDMPQAIFRSGQLLLGTAIGSRLRRDILATMPRVIVSVLALVVVFLAIVACTSFALHLLIGLPFATLILGMSPGGTAEMSTTAVALGISVSTVTAFHILRAFVVNGFAMSIYQLLSAISFFERGDKVVRRLLGRVPRG